VAVVRGQQSAIFPTRFMLVAATNPCPCGNAGSARRHCTCHAVALQRHNAKLSGPLLDRLDLVLRVESPPREELSSSGESRGSREIREKVVAARARQVARLAGTPARCNAEMTAFQVGRFCRLSADARKTLLTAYDRVGLTMRGHDRVLRVARTLADLDGRPEIDRADVAQALAYRESTARLLAA
jgi:magnesium chelatase family protein